MEIVSLHTGLVHGLQYSIDVICVAQRYNSEHIVMMIENNHRFVQYIQNVGGIVLSLCLVLHGDILEVTNGIERGVTKQTAHGSIVALNLDVINQRMDGLIGTIVLVYLVLHCAAVRVTNRSYTMCDSHTGNGINTDKASRVGCIMIIGALHQRTLRIQVAQSHIYSHWRVHIGQYCLAA